MGCEGDANVNKCFSYRHQSNGKSRKHTSKPQNIRSIFGRFLERSRQSWINAFVYFVRQKVYYDQTPKHTKYFWAFDSALPTSLIKRFCVLRTTKGLLSTNTKTYEVFFGVCIISTPDKLQENAFVYFVRLKVFLWTNLFKKNISKKVGNIT